MGAFLTFIGARRLQQKTRIRATELLDARPYKELTTMRPLVAKLSDGFGMGVSLTGAHLHGPYNSTYLLPALKAANPGTGRKIKVRLANSQDVSYYPDELEAMKNPNKDERFGFLGIHHENHYRCDTKKTFASAHEGCGLIDIGRYGPFRREGTPHWCLKDMYRFGEFFCTNTLLFHSSLIKKIESLRNILSSRRSSSVLNLASGVLVLKKV